MTSSVVAKLLRMLESHCACAKPDSGNTMPRILGIRLRLRLCANRAALGVSEVRLTILGQPMQLEFASSYKYGAVQIANRISEPKVRALK